MIAADIPAMHAVIRNYEDGLIVNPQPETIAQAVIELISNPQLAQEMGNKGYEKVRQEYNWEILAQRLSNIYEQAIMAMA